MIPKVLPAFTKAERVIYIYVGIYICVEPDIASLP